MNQLVEEIIKNHNIANCQHAQSLQDLCTKCAEAHFNRIKGLKAPELSREYEGLDLSKSPNTKEAAQICAYFATFGDPYAEEFDEINQLYCKLWYSPSPHLVKTNLKKNHMLIYGFVLCLMHMKSGAFYRETGVHFMRQLMQVSGEVGIVPTALVGFDYAALLEKE